MPIDYQIDHERRLVVARGRGTLTSEDIFSYQSKAWSGLETTGYNELVDMSQVERFASASGERMSALADLSAGMDRGGGFGSKLAVVAPSDVAFGLARMYQTYREMDGRGTKEVGVFRSHSEALAFLGIDTLEPK